MEKQNRNFIRIDNEILYGKFFDIIHSDAEIIIIQTQFDLGFDFALANFLHFCHVDPIQYK